MASSVFSVTAQPGSPWIMKPLLSYAGEFNFLSIVMSYLIHFTFIFIFKGCLLLQASFFFLPLTWTISQNYPVLGLFALWSLDNSSNTELRSALTRNIFSLWTLGNYMMTSEVQLGKLSQKVSTWFDFCFCLYYKYWSSTNILCHVGSILYPKWGMHRSQHNLNLNPIRRAKDSVRMNLPSLLVSSLEKQDNMSTFYLPNGWDSVY